MQHRMEIRTREKGIKRASDQEHAPQERKKPQDGGEKKTKKKKKKKKKKKNSMCRCYAATANNTRARTHETTPYPRAPRPIRYPTSVHVHDSI